jgi:enoyl-CoA hydratase
MKYEYLLIDKKDSICILTINNPSSLNALSQSTIAELKSAINELDADREIKVVIVTGTGKAFVAGGDISYMKNLNSIDAQNYSSEVAAVYKLLGDTPKVYIAAINGFALGGGCEFALACDIRIASTRAKLGLPETGLGIIPGGGGTQRLSRLIGAGKAKELIFTCDIIDAEKANSIGLVNNVVEPDTLLDEAAAIAHKIIKNGPIAVSYAKSAIDNGLQMDLDTAIDYENRLFGLCFATEDQKEGMAAFSEKRQPQFKNR